MEALYAIAIINDFPKLKFSSVFLFSETFEIIAIPTGSIIIVVAVLEINIDNIAVAIMKPKIILDFLVPVYFIILRATLLCKFHFSIASAMIKPPTKRKTKLWP